MFSIELDFGTNSVRDVVVNWKKGRKNKKTIARGEIPEKSS